ncbi:hypothetical protein D3C77_28480 [compost metagenome]
MKIGFSWVVGFIRLIALGLKAWTVQFYDELNAKKGTRFEASRQVTGALNQVFWSVIVTGDNPVDLKRREFGFNGDGVTADIFFDVTHTGGTVDPVYNGNDIIPANFDFQLIAGADLVVTFDPNKKLGATVYLFGSTSNQSRGSIPNAVGTNYILAPHSEYAFRFTSRSADQLIAARLTGYNGPLDTTI